MDLPDDVSQWPSDPYAVLGVPRSSDLETLRRAYARLIRKYRPEQAPAQFARVRAAYELAQQFLQWRTEDGEWAEESAESPAAATPPGGAPDFPPSGPHSDAPPARPAADAALQTALAAAWQLAVQGAWPAARAALTELRAQHARNADVALRLYFLERIAPPDAQPQPAWPWLLCAVEESGFQGEGVRLLLAEAALGRAWLADLDVRTVQRFLLAARDAPWALELWANRWDAAVFQRRPEMIDADLQALEQATALQNPAFWTRLLLVAAWAWARSARSIAPEHLARLVRAVEESAPASQEVSQELAQLDHVVDCYRQMQVTGLEGPTDLLRGICESIGLPPTEPPRGLFRALEPYAGDPRRLLAELDRLAPRGPLLYVFLCEALERWLWFSGLQPVVQTQDETHDVLDLENHLLEYWPDVGRRGSFRQRMLDCAVGNYWLPNRFFAAAQRVAERRPVAAAAFSELSRDLPWRAAHLGGLALSG